MHDLSLTAAGLLAMVLALIHGWLSQRYLLSRVMIDGGSLKRLNAGVYQLSTLYWFAGGVALVFAPVQEQPVRQLIALGAATMYGAAVMVNLWATRGRHFGAYLFAVVAALCVAGA